MVSKYELPVPEAAILDPNAQEVVRAWVAANGLHCSLSVGQWEPHVWGILMADLVRHVVDAEIEEKGSKPDEVVTLIVDQFMKDLAKLMQEHRLGVSE